MFTLKLQQHSPRQPDNSPSKVRIVAAESFTLYWYGGNGACQITAHRKDSADDKCFWVGSPQAVDHGLPIDAIMYDRAFIENAAGKTTEMILPEPINMSSSQRAA